MRTGHHISPDSSPKSSEKDKVPGFPRVELKWFFKREKLNCFSTSDGFDLWSFMIHKYAINWAELACSASSHLFVGVSSLGPIRLSLSGRVHCSSAKTQAHQVGVWQICPKPFLVHQNTWTGRKTANVQRYSGNPWLGHLVTGMPIQKYPRSINCTMILWCTVSIRFSICVWYMVQSFQSSTVYLSIPFLELGFVAERLVHQSHPGGGCPHEVQPHGHCNNILLTYQLFDIKQTLVRWKGNL